METIDVTWVARRGHTLFQGVSMKILSMIVLAVSFTLPMAHAESTLEANFRKLDSYFDQLQQFKKAQGSVLLFKDGKAIYQKHFAESKSEAPLPKEPLYRIGSISKVYTATIILKLVEKGQLSLDSKLSEFYPQLPEAAQITIEQLLRHRTGLPNLTAQKDYADYFENEISEVEQIERFKKYKLHFKPNQKMEYSNTNYVLLSYIAQKVAGKKLSELLSQYIAVPLKLRNTFIYEKAKPRPGEVTSYTKDLDWQKATDTHQSVPMGAGAIVSSPTELAQFIRALIRGEIIDKTLVDKMKQQQDGYGLGLITFPYGKKRAYGHNGSIDGFRSTLGYFEEDDLVTVELYNALATDSNAVSLALLKAQEGAAFDPPTVKATVTVDPQILAKYEGVYSEKSFPLKITISQKQGSLYAQATGQSAFALEAESNTEFAYAAAGIQIEFLEDGKLLELTQGQTYRLKRE